MIIIFFLLSLILNLSISARVLSSSSEINPLNGLGGSISSSLRPSPVVPSPFSNTQRSLPAIKVDPKGLKYTYRYIYINHNNNNNYYYSYLI